MGDINGQAHPGNESQLGKVAASHGCRLWDVQHQRLDGQSLRTGNASTTTFSSHDGQLLGEEAATAEAMPTQSSHQEVHGRDVGHLPQVPGMRETMEVVRRSQSVGSSRQGSSQEHCSADGRQVQQQQQGGTFSQLFFPGPMGSSRRHGLGRARRGRLITRTQAVKRLLWLVNAMSVVCMPADSIDVVLAGNLAGALPLLAEDLGTANVKAFAMPTTRQCPKVSQRAKLLISDGQDVELIQLALWLHKREKVAAVGVLETRDALQNLSKQTTEILKKLHRKKVSQSHIWFSTHMQWLPGWHMSSLDNSGLTPTTLICSLVMSGLLMMEPGRAILPRPSHQVLWLDIEKDRQQWFGLLCDLRDLLRDRASPLWEPPETHPLRAKLLALIPWKLERLHVVKTPKQRRFPTEIPWTHRGCALLHLDDSVSLESESMHDTAFPRARFVKPVAVGVFFYGYAPEQPEQFQPEDQPQAHSTPVPPPRAPIADRHLIRAREGITFSVNPQQVPPEICQVVARMHCALGHPAEADLVRMLSHQGASVTSILAAKALHCEFCKRHKPMRSPPPTSAPVIGQWNDRLQMDIFYVHDLSHRQVLVLGAVDMATSYHVARRIESRDSAVVLKAFTSMWLTPFGMPLEVYSDADGAFRGQFSDALTTLGIHLRHVPADAHHQLGKVERHNYVLKLMLRKILDQLAVSSLDQFDIAIVMATAAKNDMIRRAGRPPSMAVFGRCPRLPSQLLADSENHAALSNLSIDDRMSFASQCRREATKAFADVDSRESLRAAVLRKVPLTRPEELQPGQKVAFFRTKSVSKRGSRQKRAGYQLGTFVCADPGVDSRGSYSSAWVQCGGRLIQVSTQQLRPAQGFESWNPSPEDLRDLDQAEQAWREGTEIHAEEEAPSAAHEEPPLHVFQDLPSTPRIPSTPGFLPSVWPQDDDDWGEDVLPDQSQPQSATSPRRVDLEAGDQDADMSQATSSRLRSSPDHDEEAERASKLPRRDNEAVNVAMLSDTLVVEDGMARLIVPSGYDGSPTVLSAHTTWESKHDVQQSSDSDSDQEDKRACHVASTNSHLPVLTPDLQSIHDSKQLQKELPWQWILQQSPSFVQQFVEAAQKEAASWEVWAPVKPVPPARAREILSNPSLRRRVMKARSLYRDKNIGFGDLKAKARVVIAGFTDPDLTTLQRYAPVATRLSLHLLLQLVASSWGTLSKWKLASGDIATAFLQGVQHRESPIYMLPPKDGITQLAGTFQDELYEVVGNVYGLANAPHTFCQKVIAVMTDLNARPHPLDQMCFLWRTSQGLVCMAIFHVDDMLVAWDPEKFEIEIVRNSFEWGSWSDICQGDISYLGKTISLKNGQLILHQQKFTRQTQADRWKWTGDKRSSIPPEELSHFRALSGAMQWLSGSTRPDLASGTSLLQSGAPTIEDYQNLCEHLNYAKQTEQAGIVFHPVDLQRPLLVGYGDSSFANAEGKRSQAGLCVVLTSRDAMQSECKGTLIDWKSHRSRRVVRSTLSAEACAADAACDHLQYTSAFMGMLLEGTGVKDTYSHIPFALFTDCKSLYDAVLQTTPSLEEKRCSIDIASIREALVEISKLHPFLPGRLHWSCSCSDYRQPDQ